MTLPNPTKKERRWYYKYFLKQPVETRAEFIIIPDWEIKYFSEVRMFFKSPDIVVVTPSERMLYYAFLITLTNLK